MKPVVPPKHISARSRRWRENLDAWMFLSPWAVGFGLFLAFPILYSFYLAFCHWDMITAKPDFVGLGNFIKIFTRDPRFVHSLAVTSLYALGSVPLTLGAALVLASLLNHQFSGIGVFRTIFYLPAVVSGVAVSILWMGLLNPDQGLVNRILGFVLCPLGLPHDSLPGWLFSERWALPAIILMSLWNVGPPCVIFLAGLQGIPRDLQEAALIDGAGPVRRWCSVTLPLITPMILFNIIIGVINSFQVFTQGYVMTGGGPRDATLFYVLYVWQKAFVEFRAGYASALAWILFVVILVLSLLVLQSSRRWVHYSGGDEA